MVRTLAFLLVRRLLGLVGAGPAPDATDVEIAVPRHQLGVLRRQVARPRYTPSDRIILATLAKLLPRDRWAVFLVTPATLPRWHRNLARRRWTYPNTPHRRTLEEDIVDLVPRLARENPRWGTSASWPSAASSACRSPRPRYAPSCAATGSDPLHAATRGCSTSWHRRRARVVVAGHAFVHLRRGHDKQAIDQPVQLRVATAFSEFAPAV